MFFLETVYNVEYYLVPMGTKTNVHVSNKSRCTRHVVKK